MIGEVLVTIFVSVIILVLGIGWVVESYDRWMDERRRKEK